MLCLSEKKYNTFITFSNIRYIKNKMNIQQESAVYYSSLGQRLYLFVYDVFWIKAVVTIVIILLGIYMIIIFDYLIFIN